MSAALAQDPGPLTPLSDVQRLIAELPEPDRKRLKNWAVPSIRQAHARLFEEPLRQALIEEVVREVVLAYFSVRSLVKATSQSSHAASAEAVVVGEMRRLEAFLEDPDAAEALDFIFQARMLLLSVVESVRTRAPEMDAALARLKEAAGAEHGLFLVNADVSAEQAQMKDAGKGLLDLIATNDLEGTSRALLIIEAVMVAARSRDSSLRARAIELTRWAGREAECGAAALLGVKLEPCYDDFGRRKGGPEAVEARKMRRQTWHSIGWWAAWWLARRLRTERDVEVLADAASALADIGQEAVDPIVKELRHAWPDGPPEQVEALLGALRWLPAEDAAAVELVEGALAPWLGHADPDLRERAVAATAALPVDDACRLLRKAAESETDTVLRDLMHDEIAARGAEAAASRGVP